MKPSAPTLLAAIPIAWAALPPRTVDLERHVASLLPEATVLYVEAPGARELFVDGLRHPLVATLLRSPVGELVRERTKVPPAMALGMLNLWAGRPVLPTLASMTEGGFAAGVVPRVGDEPEVLCIAARGDATVWREAVELAMTKIAEARGLPLDKVVPPHRRIRGMDVWLLGDSGALALEDGVFLASNDEETLRSMIDLGAAPEPGGLGARASFRAARPGTGADPFAWAWADLDGMQAAGMELEELREVAGAPGAHLALGSMVAVLASAREAVLELDVGADRIHVSLTGRGVEDGVGRELLAPLDGSAPPLPAGTPAEAARGVVYRDLAGLFRHRVELFPPEAQPRFAEAASNLALFFEGADVAEDVLPGIDPWIGFVAREVEFDRRAVPEVPLPAAAAVLRLREPDVLGPRLVTAFQSFLAILNVQAAQEQQPGLTLSLEMHGGRTITLGRFRTPAEDEGVDVRYNLVPACTVAGDAFVIGTHVALVRDVAAQLDAGELGEPPAGETLSISGPRLAEVVRANREALAMNAVLNEGKTEEEADADVAGILAVAEVVETLSVATSRPSADDLRVELSLALVVEPAEEDR